MNKLNIKLHYTVLESSYKDCMEHVGRGLPRAGQDSREIEEVKYTLNNTEVNEIQGRTNIVGYAHAKDLSAEQVLVIIYHLENNPFIHIPYPVISTIELTLEDGTIAKVSNNIPNLQQLFKILLNKA